MAETDGIPAQLVSTVDRTRPGDSSAARSALAGFGAATLQALLGSGLSNTAISPYSLFTVLAMARAGARGRTAAQIDAALGLSGGDAQGQAVAAVDRGISAALDRAGQVPGTSITVQAANETWIGRNFPVHQEYLDELAREFGVAARAADFAGDPDGMRAAINAWVAERTNTLIPELFPVGSITSATELVLVNALYLKASWMLPFGDRQDGPFTRADGTVVAAPMMRAPMPLSGMRGDGWAAVSIPYSGAGLAMTVLLPDAGVDAILGDLPSVIDAVATGSGSSTRFELTLPAFSVDATPDVMTAVQALGITDLFGAADLSGISESALSADTLVHRCVVTVDEYGTEAAAATGMAMAGSAPSRPEALVVDRPFVFWIAETRTSAPLFLGVVADPGVSA